jgi:hypothetical protein
LALAVGERLDGGVDEVGVVEVGGFAGGFVGYGEKARGVDDGCFF